MTLEQDQALVRAANEHTRLPLTVLLVGDWRITETLGGWCLEYQEPAMLQWVEMFFDPSLVTCKEAYETYCEGETPQATEFWP